MAELTKEAKRVCELLGLSEEAFMAAAGEKWTEFVCNPAVANSRSANGLTPEQEKVCQLLGLTAEAFLPAGPPAPDEADFTERVYAGQTLLYERRWRPVVLPPLR